VLRLIFILGFALSLSLQARQPNVLLIMTDDQGWGNVGFNVNKTISTRHLDVMAREGLRFARFYAASRVAAISQDATSVGMVIILSMPGI
tara:strand:- start:105 stop:374 length:270 start_codon:yes stop_codon:yes gene_type:complete